MTCSGFSDIVRELARGLEGAEAESARTHLQGCAACRELYEDERLLSEGLAALAASMEPLRAPPGVEKRLRQAIRERNGTYARSKAAWLRWAAIPVAVAAAAALFFVPRTRQAIEPLGGADPVARAVAKAPAIAERSPARLAAATPARRAPRPVLARSSRPQREEVMRFVPVRFAPALLPGETAEVVRISLPGSAMGRFGVYVPPEMAARRVNADVLMGEDGVARAIRFVH